VQEGSPLCLETVPPRHPPILNVAAEFDPLRDEAASYAEKLKAAGVPVTFRLERGLMHSFSNLGGVIPQGLAAFDRAVQRWPPHCKKSSRA
jgi:acetyl esterase